MPARTEDLQRLIVGFSLKGPYNRPVTVRSKDEFKRIFGGISKKLERKGCYFHRTALQALDGGPVICLNVRNLKEAKAGCYSVDLGALKATKEGNVSPADLHDTSRFWEVTEYVPENVTPNTYMTVSSTVSADEQVTVYVAKADNKDYNNTFQSYYLATSQEMPEWAEKYANKIMGDYFIDVWAFKGDVNSSVSDDEKDLLKDPDTLSRKGTSGFIGKWHGIAFPNMYTANGTALSISDKFNAAWEDHKCVLALSEDWLYADGNELTIAKGFVMASAPEDGNVEGASASTASEGGDEPTTGEPTTDEPTTGEPTTGEPTTGEPTTTATETEYIVLKGWENSLDGIIPADEVLGALDPVAQDDDFAGIREALTNTNDLYFKYIVDSFGYEGTGSSYSGPGKLHVELAKLAQARIGCLAILNLPTFKDLGVKGTTGKDYIEGLVLPGEADGASFCAYYTPVAVVENRGKIIVPSAGAVSVAFQRKWATGMPYDIVAGPNKGVLPSSAVLGPMVNWSRPDLDALEPFGVNAVVFIPGKGTFINSNKTALKNPITTLSAVNVREVCTYLQDAVEKILADYQWEFNTPELRMTVKSLVDKKCEEIQANGGMYRFVTVCDESNNTDEVIDNEMFIIDIAIEPGRGAGKMIQHLTLYKKGGISAMYNAG
jgi:hypothetical protein